MEIEYKVREYEDRIEVIALVSDYGFRPEGTKEDWIKYAEKIPKSNNFKNIEVYEEQQDKETGYCSYKLIHKIQA